MAISLGKDFEFFKSFFHILSSSNIQPVVYLKRFCITENELQVNYENVCIIFNDSFLFGDSIFYYDGFI